MARRSWGKITRKGKRFYAEYSGPDLRRHTPGHSFPDKHAAELWLAQERRLIDLDAWQPPAERAAKRAADSLTVGEWLTQHHALLGEGAHPLRPSTLQNYWKVIRLRILDPISPGDRDQDVTRLAGLPLTTLSKHDVYRWWDGVQRSYTGTTISQQAYKRLRAACSEAVRRGMIDVNPVDVPGAQKRIVGKGKYLPSDGEIAKILGTVPAEYRVLTSLVLHHGLRIGEALAVERDDVTVEPTPVPLMPRVTVSVRRNAQRITGDDGTFMLVQPPKTKAGVRDVPIMARDVPMFLAHLAAHDFTPVPVATVDGVRQARLLTRTKHGKIVMDTSYRSILTRAEEKAGVTTEIDPHCGRNWLITRLAEQGAHLKEIGALLGQDDLSTIMDVYLKVRAGRTVTLIDAVNRSIEC